MPPITVLDNQFATVWYYPETKIVHHEIHKFLHGKSFRETLNCGAELIEKYHACKWLSDDRRNNAIPAADMKWAANEWRPRILKAGWKFWALVMPENVIGKMNMEQFVKEYATLGITVKVFSDPGTAQAWLESQ